MSKKIENFLKELKKNKIKKKILNIAEKIEREKFFDSIFKDKLYEFDKIQIGCGEKSDNPLILFKMIQLLDAKKKSRVLEIGTGSGYSTSILASLYDEVVTIEYHEELALSAKNRLEKLHFKNIKFFAGDASDIKTDLGKFDAVIIFTACLHKPYSIIYMLNETSSMILPMGPPVQQQIAKYTTGVTEDNKPSESLNFFDFCEYRSMYGKYGWVDQDNSYIVDEADDTEEDDSEEVN